MSDYFIAKNVASLYAEPRSSSELVTQAILGMTVSGEREENGYVFVHTPDRYQGWIGAHYLVAAWDDADYLKTNIACLFADLYTEPDSHSELLTKLTVSTKVAIAHRSEVEEWVPLLLPDKKIGYVHRACLNITHGDSNQSSELLDASARRALDVSALKKQVLAAVGRQATLVAMRFIGTPYLWGGCTPFGIDCSGFVQLAYKLSGLQLLRDADIQFADRRFIPVEESKALSEAVFEPGDLLVFSSREDRYITHIGLALGDGRFIHSAGKYGVAITPCSDPDYIRTYLAAARIAADADLDIEAA